MHRYMSNAGYDESRNAVAAVLAEASALPVAGAQVVMTCGASGALNVVLKTILNPGEEVIILAPFFVEYKFYIDNHGGVPREVWTDRETFQLDLPPSRRLSTRRRGPSSSIPPTTRPARSTTRKACGSWGCSPAEGAGVGAADIRHLRRAVRPDHL